MQELERALGRARVAVRKPEVGIDDTDQVEFREMVTLGDKLGADHDIDVAALDLGKLRAHALDAGDEIARQHQNARLRKQRRHLLLEPLDARPAGDETLGRCTFGTRLRWRYRKAAVVADQPALEAVIDEPCITVWAGEAEAALPAERERRVAAAVEEQKRLLAALDGGLHGLREPRRDETAARRAFAAQVDGLDRRQVLTAKTFRKRQAAVAAAARVDLSFN